MLNSIQLSTYICVRAQVIAAEKERKERRGRGDCRDGDGEHLIAACNAGEEGEQALDEVLAVAPFLVLRRNLFIYINLVRDRRQERLCGVLHRICGGVTYLIFWKKLNFSMVSKLINLASLLTSWIFNILTAIIRAVVGIFRPFHCGCYRIIDVAISNAIIVL